jgi:predicted nucleotidyltransferase
MHKPSSTSVKIHWLDSQSVIEKLKIVARQMKARHPEIEQVLLFGSLARGEAVPGSDADLLVILSSTTQPLMARIPHYLPVGLPLGVDVFPYTQEEIDRMLAEGNSFIRHAVQEGVALT